MAEKPLMAEVVQLRDYQSKRDHKALEREAMAIVNEIFAFAADQSPDTAPSEMNMDEGA